MPSLHALIDSDTLAYAAAVSVSDDQPEYYALSRCDTSVKTLLDDLQCDSYSLYVSAGSNFRKEIDPTYKGNRPPSPKHRQACHDFLVSQWGAIECIGYEADDACGIHQRTNGSTVIVGIDKDLLQIPGKHYSWPIVRKGVVVREALWQEIDEEQGFRNLFTQCLTGDTSDNIIGVRGLGKAKAPKLLADCHTEEEMYDVCLNQYLNDEETDEGIQYQVERFERNLNLLWIWRELGVTYSIRKEQRG